jgi:hypothetical protein
MQLARPTSRLPADRGQDRDTEVQDPDPREMERAAAGESYSGIFSRFIAAYETIRYAGSRSEQDRGALEDGIGEADSAVGEDTHEGS